MLAACGACAWVMAMDSTGATTISASEGNRAVRFVRMDSTFQYFVEVSTAVYLDRIGVVA
jgi:hypothetical protein